MPGRTLQILPRVPFNFSGLPASGSLLVNIAEQVDVAEWWRSILCFRLHSATWGTTGAKVELLWSPDGFTLEDPGAMWQSALAVAATFTQGVDASPPTAKFAAISPGCPALVAFHVRATMGTTPSTFDIILSCDLVNRPF